MALYRPDYKLQEAKKIIDKLDPNEEGSELILYYIKDKERYIKELQARIAEYGKFFETLDKFLPNHNSILR